MVVARAQYLVYNVAIVGKEDEALRRFIKPTDGEDALGVVDVGNNVALDIGLGGAGHPHGLIEGDKHIILCAGDSFVVYFYHIAGQYPVAQSTHHAIERNPPRRYQLISLPARAKARAADVFVEAGGFGWVGGQLMRLII